MINIQNPMSFELEISVLSCEGLSLISKSSSSSSSSSVWSTLLLLFMSPTIMSVAKLPDKEPKVYSGRVEEGEGGVLVLRVPADSSFLSDTQSCLHLEIYRKRRILGPTQVGWCLIPASDIGPPSPPWVRYLIYRLRGRDGCRVGATINLRIKLKLKNNNTCAIGIPIGTRTMQEGRVKSGC